MFDLAYTFAEYLQDHKIIESAIEVDANTVASYWDGYGEKYIHYCLKNGYDYEDIRWQRTGVSTEIFLTTAQTAQRFGVSRKTVLSWIRKGLIPTAKKFGRDWMIPLDAKRPVDRRYVENPKRNRRKMKAGENGACASATESSGLE